MCFCSFSQITKKVIQIRAINKERIGISFSFVISALLNVVDIAIIIAKQINENIIKTKKISFFDIVVFLFFLRIYSFTDRNNNSFEIIIAINHIIVFSVKVLVSVVAPCCSQGFFLFSPSSSPYKNLSVYL